TAPTGAGFRNRSDRPRSRAAAATVRGGAQSSGPPAARPDRATAPEGRAPCTGSDRGAARKRPPIAAARASAPPRRAGAWPKPPPPDRRAGAAPPRARPTRWPQPPRSGPDRTAPAAGRRRRACPGQSAPRARPGFPGAATPKERPGRRRRTAAAARPGARACCASWPRARAPSDSACAPGRSRAWPAGAAKSRAARWLPRAGAALPSPCLLSESRRLEHALEQPVDLLAHALGGLTAHRRQRGLDLAQVLELREQLDVGHGLARGEPIADHLELAQERIEPGVASRHAPRARVLAVPALDHRID